MMNSNLLPLLRASEPAERLLAASLTEGDCAQVMESIYVELVQSREALSRALSQFLHATGRAEEWLRCVLCHEGVPRDYERAYYELALARREVTDDTLPASRREAPLWPAGEQGVEEEDLALWHPVYFDGERRRRGAGRRMR
jgi:hypothetical protein